MSVTAFGVRVKEEPGSSAQSSSEGVCYVCSSPGAEYPLNSRPRERGPYFPFLETHIPPLGADRPTSEGIVLACPVCYSFLTQQWEAHEQNGTPRNKRMYWLKRTDNGPYAGMEPSMQAQEESPERGSRQSPVAATAALDLSLPPPSTASAAPATTTNETCFICGGGTRNGPLANVYAKPIANCPFFPSLASHPLPPGAKPMDSAGRVQACETCHRSLLEQWDSYQRYTVPHSERRYRLPSRAFTCFTCGLEFPVSAQRVVHAVPGPDQQPGFPFLRTVAPPPGAQPLTSAGRALVCSMCYKSLQRQLRVFEISNVPEAKRHFKILHEGTTTPSSAALPSSPASVLRKQLLSPQTKYLGCYLCEKIGPLESLVSCDTTPSVGPHFPFLRDVARPIAARPMDNQGRVLLCAECRAELQLQWDAFESAGLPLPQRRYHTASLTSPPCTSPNTCFVCAEPMSESFPVGSREGPGPFFPFLESHMGPGTLDSTGTARACTFCFHSLMAQWLAYESSPHPEDAARAARRYNTHHYVCYICGITTYRRRVRTLTVRDFPFLREHPRPAGALTLRDGVVSCLTCSESLSSQWKDYERMRVPVEMRKYNWIVLPPPPEEARSEGSSPTGQEQGLSDSPGFPPPGGKPPPLQPAATKPGHTSLALSATRTSSFAAALRKLAKQAVDPVLDKDSGPTASIPGGNPRSLTPKRSSSYGLPSPMACGSPPVMSGAPSGLLMEARKALDLGSLSSQHGHRLDHTNKMDPSSLSSLDYLSGKHMAGPPGGASGAAHKGAAGNGEDCPRGFQPYRGSAEELRHPVLGTLHPMSPFEAGSYPYHPAPFLPPHLAHPAYRLEDPLYQYNLLRPGPPMVSAPAIPPFYRYPMQQQQQQQAPHQQPPAQQPQPPLPVAPPRTEESKEEQPRLLLLPPSAKRAADSPPSPLGPSHPGGGLEPLRSPPSLLTPLNLATGHSGPPSQPQGPLAGAQQSFADHLGHPASTEPWRPLTNDGPSLHHLQVTKENFQPLPASFTAALAPTAVRQPPPAALRSSLPLAHSPPTSSSSSPNPVRQSPIRLDIPTTEQRQAEQQPAVLSRLDVAERRRKEARARGLADSDSDEDDDWEMTIQKPVVWSGPPLRLDLNPKKLQFLNHVGLTSHLKRKELELEQFLRQWTRLHGSEEGLCPAPPLLPEKSVNRAEEKKDGAPAPSEQQRRRTGPLSPCKGAREADQQLKRQFLHLLGLSPSGTNEDREAIWRAIVIERSQRNGAVCRESSLSNPSHRPALTSAGYLQRRALKRQLAASVEMHQNGVCAAADGPPCRKVPSIQAPQRKPCGRDFSQEFHESVLHDSQPQQEHQLKKRRQRPSYSIFHTRVPPAAAPSPAEESALTVAGEDCVQDSTEPVPAPFHWPGVEAIMESYSRYNQERHMEQVLLTERERQLRAEQQQLQEEAQRLRLQMAELYRSKKRLDEERQEQQMTIDNLKKCLRLVR